MNGCITYDTNNKVIWGSGETVKESEEDAATCLNHYQQSTDPSYRCSFVTVPACPTLLECVDKWGSDVDWFLHEGAAYLRVEQD